MHSTHYGSWVFNIVLPFYVVAPRVQNSFYAVSTRSTAVLVALMCPLSDRLDIDSIQKVTFSLPPSVNFHFCFPATPFPHTYTKTHQHMHHITVHHTMQGGEQSIKLSSALGAM
jgi:hypothetical protein